MFGLIAHIVGVLLVVAAFVAGWFIGGNHASGVAAVKAKLAADAAAAKAVAAAAKVVASNVATGK